MTRLDRRFPAHLTLALGAAFVLVWAQGCLAWTSASTLAAAQDASKQSTGAVAAEAATADAKLVARIAAQLANLGGVRATFRQTQTVAALSAPLMSTGQLVFSPERGVIWYTETPRSVTYVIGDANVTTIDAKGNRSTRGAARGGVAQVSKMMRAILAGDLSALYSQFDVAAEGTPTRWRLLLTPNQLQLAQAVKSLRIDGGAFLTMLEIVAPNGDSTRIELSSSERIGTLSPAELAWFGAR